MGCSQNFRCKSCGLSATVSGGDDHGFYATTQTRYCVKCETLVDVCTKMRSSNNSDTATEADAPDDELGKCQHCSASPDITWQAGEPCPRCSGAVEATGEQVINWD